MNALAVSTPDPLACPTVQSRRKILPTMPAPSRLSGSVLRIYERGGMVRIRIGGKLPDRVRKPSTQLLTPDHEEDGQADGARVRRPIQGMSRKSLDALRERLAGLDRDAFALLITLTWPDWARPEGREFRQPWSRFRKRLAYDWPDVGGVQRVELTRKGVVHIHAVAYGVKPGRANVRAFREWVAVAWSECVRADKQEVRRRVGSSVEVPRQGNAVQRYVAKYMSKPETPVDLRIGRWWDTWNDAALPTVAPTVIPLTDEEAHVIKGLMDEKIRVSYIARRLRRGATMDEAVEGWLSIPRPAYDRRVLTEDPAEWLDYLQALRDGEHPNTLMDRLQASEWTLQHRQTERLEKKRGSTPTSPANGPARAAHLQGIA